MHFFSDLTCSERSDRVFWNATPDFPLFQNLNDRPNSIRRTHSLLSTLFRKLQMPVDHCNVKGFAAQITNDFGFRCRHRPGILLRLYCFKQSGHRGIKCYCKRFDLVKKKVLALVSVSNALVNVIKARNLFNSIYMYLFNFPFLNACHTTHLSYNIQYTFLLITC